MVRTFNCGNAGNTIVVPPWRRRRSGLLHGHLLTVVGCFPSAVALPGAVRSSSPRSSCSSRAEGVTRPSCGGGRQHLCRTQRPEPELFSGDAVLAHFSLKGIDSAIVRSRLHDSDEWTRFSNLKVVMPGSLSLRDGYTNTILHVHEANMPS